MNARLSCGFFYFIFFCRAPTSGLKAAKAKAGANLPLRGLVLGDAISCDLPVEVAEIRKEKCEDVRLIRHKYASAPPTPYIAFLRQVLVRRPKILGLPLLYPTHFFDPGLFFRLGPAESLSFAPVARCSLSLCSRALTRSTSTTTACTSSA